MLWMKLLRLLRGFVTFRATGGFPERFLNLCRVRHIAIWRLRTKNGVLTARTAAADYTRLREVAARSGMRLQILKKRGAPFVLRRYRNRYGLLIGLAAVCLLLLPLHGRIWRIEVQNSTTVPTATILAAFTQAGVRQGVRIDRLDESTVENTALLQLPDIQWANINFGGCTAEIEVRQATRETVEEPPDQPANLVAARDGTVTELRVFRGTAAVKRGAPVLKGELLIGGMTENKDGSTGFCRADGYITAATTRTYSVPLLRHRTVQQQTALRQRLRPDVFALTLPAPANGGFRERTALMLRGVPLPFALITYTARETAAADCAFSDADAQLLGALDFFDRCCTALQGVEVTHCDLRMEGDTLRGTFACIENIGARVPLEIAEEPTPQAETDPQTAATPSAGRS